ncbi:hypothetical protein BV25DRAFT_711552 [Artomyces pyxidatus]|uniref:Uncharacterized protein n=1 Tax=Artomyces pyxidatus TaxID=48021 RepID=A0ACB8SZH7_9AGAM|nr:hypothetical protein BV25DRAFT_711552 [Artomyces pyxidatus]
MDSPASSFFSFSFSFAATQPYAPLCDSPTSGSPEIHSTDGPFDSDATMLLPPLDLSAVKAARAAEALGLPTADLPLSKDVDPQTPPGLPRRQPRALPGSSDPIYHGATLDRLLSQLSPRMFIGLHRQAPQPAPPSKNVQPQEPPSILWPDAPRWGQWGECLEFSHILTLSSVGVGAKYKPVKVVSQQRLERVTLTVPVPLVELGSAQKIRLTRSQMGAAMDFLSKSVWAGQNCVLISCAEGLEADLMAVAVLFLAWRLHRSAFEVMARILENAGVRQVWKRALSFQDVEFVQSLLSPSST